MPARFRPTLRQALANGLSAGTVVGAVLATIVVVTDLATDWGSWPIGVAALLVPPVVGALVGPLLGRERGVDADGLGIHRVPKLPPSFTPWRHVVDIRAERRGHRTVVAVHLSSGVAQRLPAPYDGRLLARDPEFERKLFTLRNLWETHRTWDVYG